MSKTEQSAKNPFSAADGQGAQATIPALEPKCLSLLTSIYITALVLTMSMASKFIAIGPFNICGATLVFPITYIFNDIFTEVYGYQRSRRIIWMGLGAQAFSVFAYWILGLWPPAPFWHNQEAYMTILGTGPRVAAASLFAYVFGEFTNSIVISKLKFKQGGEGGIKQGWRFLASTIVGEAVDTSIFFPVAFVGIIAWPELSQTMITVYLVKVLYEFVALPFSISIANAIKRQERIDVIDKPEETDYSFARF